MHQYGFSSLYVEPFFLQWNLNIARAGCAHLSCYCWQASVCQPVSPPGMGVGWVGCVIASCFAFQNVRLSLCDVTKYNESFRSWAPTLPFAGLEKLWSEDKMWLLDSLILKRHLTGVQLEQQNIRKYWTFIWKWAQGGKPHQKNLYSHHRNDLKHPARGSVQSSW